MAVNQNVHPILTSKAGSADLAFEEVAYNPHPKDREFKRVHVVLGDQNDTHAPSVFWAKDPPGVLWDKQSHPCDMLLAYVQGSQKVGDKWFKVGDFRIVKAGDVYGPIEAGPEGSTVLIVFSNADFFPNFVGSNTTNFDSPFIHHVRDPKK
jgi:hypothetical protein